MKVVMRILYRYAYVNEKMDAGTLLLFPDYGLVYSGDL